MASLFEKEVKAMGGPQDEDEIKKKKKSSFQPGKLMDAFAQALGVPEAQASNVEVPLRREEQVTKIQEGSAVLKQNPQIKDAAKTLASEAPKIIGQKLTASQQSKVESNLKDPKKLDKIASDASNNKKQSLTDSFSGALTAFLPQAVGLVVGGLFEGSEGAAAGFDEGSKISKGIQDQNNIVANREQQLALQNMSLEERKQARGVEDAQHQDRMRLEQQKIGLMKDKVAAKDAPLSVDQRKVKLSGSDKQRFDNAVGVTKALEGIASALGSGENTFSMVGDNNFTIAAAKAAEMFGRMQSGGAINKQEEERFMGMLPKMWDSAEIQQKKLTDLQDMMKDRIGTLGFTLDEVGLGGVNVNVADHQAGRAGNMGLGPSQAIAAPISDRSELERLKAKFKR